MRRKKVNSSSEQQPPQAEVVTTDNEKGRHLIWKATKAALESIGKVINYERHIKIEKDDTMDDSTFTSLPVLKVPGVHAQSIDGINNDDTNDTMEDSTVTKDYGVTKQVHRSGIRHSSSIGGYTLNLEDDYYRDQEHSTIIGKQKIQV